MGGKNKKASVSCCTAFYTNNYLLWNKCSLLKKSGAWGASCWYLHLALSPEPLREMGYLPHGISVTPWSPPKAFRCWDEISSGMRCGSYTPPPTSNHQRWCRILGEADRSDQTGYFIFSSPRFAGMRCSDPDSCFLGFFLGSWRGI